MDTQKLIKELFSFIKRSPVSFHAVDTVKHILTDKGYEELQENSQWHLEQGRSYFVTRNLSSVIAFRIPEQLEGGFHITASHSDSPCFKIKENAEIEVDKRYIKLNVEKYGGMLMAPWFDRPLSVAGRLLVQNGSSLTTKLVNVDQDLLVIPNLAIHMNREANNGLSYNAQIDMLPLFGDITASGSFMKLVADAAGVSEKDIIGNDLYLYNRVPGTIWGADDAFISSARLDDLECAYASLKGFLGASPASCLPVFCMLDNEEVGSGSKQGAASTFLKDTLERMLAALGKNTEEYYTILADSFMISADNAHAVHPNQPQKADPENRPYMNGGIVIKYSANQKYTTDAVSASIFKSLCQNAEVPYQTFLNRSDMAGGSTLGSISNTQVALNTVDIGLAQLAMHSPYETAGAKDIEYLIKVLRLFYESKIKCTKDGDYTVSREITLP